MADEKENGWREGKADIFRISWKVYKVLNLFKYYVDNMLPLKNFHFVEWMDKPVEILHLSLRLIKEIVNIGI